jgi:hypothetical protein
LAGCIDRGLEAVEGAQEAIRPFVEEIKKVDATLDPTHGNFSDRQAEFNELRQRFEGEQDPLYEHIANLMKSFEPGLFLGADLQDPVRDNLDLERWFRLTKGHERRIHGHRHAGVRIVQEGPTLVLVLDAHNTHPEEFEPDDLLPYRFATPPACQQQALSRRKIMRKARSKKQRPILLAELERQYQALL